jgi:RNA polymerase sigma-70 factor, ECF subfamily
VGSAAVTDALALEVTENASRVRLVERAMGGDPDAFDQLVRPTLDRQLRFALSLLHDEMDARDALQETCVRAWRQLPGLRDPSRFDSWMSQILVNVARNQLRKRKRVRVREVRTDQEEALSATSTQQIGDGLPQADSIRRAFDRLDPDKRLLLVLRHVEDMSVPDIATLLGIPEGTAKWRLHAARQALERALEIEDR